MGLRRAIEHGKEKRKHYRRSQAFDRSCRPHGGCPWCENNRQFADRRRRFDADEQVRDFEKEDR